MTRASATRRTADAGQAIQWPLPNPVFDFAGGGGKAVEAWMEMNQSLLGKLSDVQQEATRFVTSRLEEDMARQREFLACTSATEVVETYTAFVRKMIADYTDEARKLGELAGDMQSACTRFGATVAPASDKPASDKPA